MSIAQRAARLRCEMMAATVAAISQFIFIVFIFSSSDEKSWLRKVSHSMPTPNARNSRYFIAEIILPFITAGGVFILRADYFRQDKRAQVCNCVLRFCPSWHKIPQ